MKLSCSTLLVEARELQAALNGAAVVCGPEGGWPPALELRLDGEEPAVGYPCPYGNFAWVRFTERALASLDDDWDYRDVFTLATLDPELFS